MSIRLAALLISASALCACAASSFDEEMSAAGAPTGASPGTLSAATLDGGLGKAQALRAAGDFAGAVKTLSQLLIASPDDARIIGEYGKVLVEQGRGKEAVDFLNRATMMTPADWKLHSALGVAYDEIGNPAKARNAYEQALKLRSGEAAVLNNYAMSRIMAGDVAGAQNLMKQATVASNDPKIARNMAMIDELAAEKPVTLPEVAQPRQDGDAPHSAPTQKVVRQSLPVPDQAQAAVAKPSALKPRKTADDAKHGAGVPALRLASDTQ